MKQSLRGELEVIKGEVDIFEFVGSLLLIQSQQLL